MDPFTGEIRIWPGKKAPAYWHICDGSLLTISGNEALFSIIGTIYGGNGTSNFALPNLQGRLPIHQGTGPNLTPRPIGQSGGATGVTLTTANMPAHTHTVNAMNIPATATTVTGNYLAVPPSGYSGYQTAQGATVVAMADAALTPAYGSGGGNAQPHANTMPTISLYYIICLNGIYPVKP